jgi:putative endopeptidase
MNKYNSRGTALVPILFAFALAPVVIPRVVAETPPPVPRFSMDYMDRSIEPGRDFFRFAAGTWIKNNPVPPDKSRWGGFMELQERNWFLLHEILDATLTGGTPAAGAERQVADFYRSAMDTNRLEALRFQPIEADLQRIAALSDAPGVLRLLAEFHQRGIGAGFACTASPDEKNSAVYAVYLSQGGLGLPDRDYYLAASFAAIREAYAKHVAQMFILLGEPPAAAQSHAAVVLEMETALAQASKTRVELRDPIANYHKVPVSEMVKEYPETPLTIYLSAWGLETLRDVIVQQPDFFRALSVLAAERPLEDWRTYLRWHVLRAAAPYLQHPVEAESFAFYGRTLRDQLVPEPRWQRSARVIDSALGEALGQLFVARHFPASARERMLELVANIKAVFQDRLQHLEWMTAGTRAKALAKFERFTQKIGHPERFRDYAAVAIRPDDFLGNAQRATAFETRRRISRVGQPVDKSEWHMTPQTVNAYFNPSQNEIVFPAGILQPPFFDAALDDAVNYGAIGVVIGHEITHGYDDQGRKFDADGNLNDWWTEADAQAFEARAQKVVAQYNAYEVLPGLHVNGKLTLGENIADLGGASIAFEALQRVLAKNPAARRNIEGFTPEQRFFLSLSQIWRINCREAESRRLITVDPHSPGQFRGIGPHVNLAEFFEAFGIREGAPLWRAPSERARIW